MKKYFTITNSIIVLCVFVYFYILYLECNNLYYTQDDISNITNLLKYYNLNPDYSKAIIKIIEKSVEVVIVVILALVVNRILK